jgi:hypothetical protein
LHLLGENEDALGSFEHGLKQHPNDIALQLWRAFALGQLGRTDEAEKVIFTAHHLYSAQNAADFSEVFASFESCGNELWPKSVLGDITSMLASRIRLRNIAHEVRL